MKILLRIPLSLHLPLCATAAAMLLIVTSTIARADDDSEGRTGLAGRLMAKADTAEGGVTDKCGRTCPATAPGCAYEHPLLDSNHCITSCGPRTCHDPATTTTPNAGNTTGTSVSPAPAAGGGCSVAQHCPAPPAGCSYSHPLLDSSGCVTSCGPRTCENPSTTTPTPGANPTPGVTPTPGATPVPGGGTQEVLVSVIVGKGPNCSTATQTPSCPDEIAEGGASVQAVPFNGSGAAAGSSTDAYGRAILAVPPGVYTIEVSGAGATYAPTAPIVANNQGVTIVHVVGDTGIR